MEKAKTKSKAKPKAKSKSKKAKTNFETDALNLAVYLDSNFKSLQEKAVDLIPKNELAKKIQKYLNDHADRIDDNELLGIIGIHDVYRNHTGGRIHLIIGLRGPLVESVQPKVVSQPIDYEYKNKLLIKAVQITSDTQAPKVGNIHFHLFHCSGRNVSPRTLLEFIRSEHGYQNDLQQIADSRMSVLVNLKGKPYWRPNVNADMVQTIFNP